MITSDQRGFAGVRPTATHAPPANMRSPVLRSPAQSVFRRAGRSSELTASSGKKPPNRRKSPKKIITSDHGGFAGVRPPHHAASSGEHSLTGVELAGAVCLPTSGALVGADDFLRLRFFRLFFLDYFDATGHYNGTINYKLTGSTHNPKDACQIRFAAWERRKLSSMKAPSRCDEVVFSSGADFWLN